MSLAKKMESKVFVKRLIDSENILTPKSRKLKSDRLEIIDNRIGEKPKLLPEHFGGDYFLSPENAALFLDVSRKFIYELIARGDLKATTVGGRLRRIRRSDLELWLTSSNSGPVKRTRSYEGEIP